jgi:hypothetical protein
MMPVPAQIVYQKINDSAQAPETEKSACLESTQTHLPTILDIHLCDTSSRHRRALMKPAQFFNKRPRQSWVLFQICELIRVLKQRDDPQIDHVDHGCVAGDEEEECQLHRLVFGDVTWLYLV